MATKKPERRVFPIQFRQEDGEKPKLAGHAAVFNQPEEIYEGFIEVVEPGAFQESIARGDDIRALLNHNPDHVLARTANGTLRLWEDEIGLMAEIDPPDTQQGRDTVTLVKRGDISQMSYAFIVIDERNEKVDGKRLRVIVKADLFDVSPVTYPAFPTTDISVRKLSNGVEYKTGRNNGVTVNVHVDGHIEGEDQAGSNGTNESDGDKAKRAGRSASRKRKLDLTDKINRQEDKEFDITRNAR